MSEEAGRAVVTIVIFIDFVALIAAWAATVYFSTKRLKSAVSHWTPMMGNYILVGMGRDKIFIIGRANDIREALKLKLQGTDTSTVSDNDLDLFIKYYNRTNFQHLVACLAMVALIAAEGRVGYALGIVR